jgi:hypothetical protein
VKRGFQSERVLLGDAGAVVAVVVLVVLLVWAVVSVGLSAQYQLMPNVPESAPVSPHPPAQREQQE